MCLRWVLTVSTETISCLAISALVSPSTTRYRTSRSRAVSGSVNAMESSWRLRRTGLGSRWQLLTRGDGPHRGDERLRRRPLEQEGARSGTHRLVGVFVEVEGG